MFIIMLDTFVEWKVNLLTHKCGKAENVRKWSLRQVTMTKNVSLPEICTPICNFAHQLGIDALAPAFLVVFSLLGVW